VVRDFLFAARRSRKSVTAPSAGFSNSAVSTTSTYAVVDVSGAVSGASETSTMSNPESR
jgi:hypothetical protein